MKLYSDYEFASIKMSCDEQQFNALRRLADEKDIQFVFETGTYKGDGSTKMLAEIFGQATHFKRLITCEVDFHLYKIAKQNLSTFAKVEVLHGLSVGLAEAKHFVKNDETIKNHNEYPDIFIDDVDNPIDFYLREVNGNLSQKELNAAFEENIFGKYLPTLEGNVLVSLDSAGGIGFLEFTQMLHYCSSWGKYWLLLDDVHHLKHFRSRLHIYEDPKFKVLAESVSNGWLLAEYNCEH